MDKDNESSGVVIFQTTDEAIEALIAIQCKCILDCQILFKFENNSEPVQEVSTSHANPNWLNNLKMGFNSIVVQKCSLQTKLAVENNEYIENNFEFRKIKTELISTLMEQVKSSFGSIGKPPIDQWREIANLLGHKYPAMFHDTGEEILGKRKIDSVKRLAQKLCDNYR